MGEGPEFPQSDSSAPRTFLIPGVEQPQTARKPSSLQSLIRLPELAFRFRPPLTPEKAQQELKARKSHVH